MIYTHNEYADLLCDVGVPRYAIRATNLRFMVYMNVDVMCRNCAHKFVQLYQLSSGQNVGFITIL